MDSTTAIFNIYSCDYGTVSVDKNKTRQLLTNLVLGKIPGRFVRTHLHSSPIQMLFNEVADRPIT